MRGRRTQQESEGVWARRVWTSPLPGSVDRGVGLLCYRRGFLNSTRLCWWGEQVSERLSQVLSWQPSSMKHAQISCGIEEVQYGVRPGRENVGEKSQAQKRNTENYPGSSRVWTSGRTKSRCCHCPAFKTPVDQDMHQVTLVRDSVIGTLRARRSTTAGCLAPDLVILSGYNGSPKAPSRSATATDSVACDNEGCLADDGLEASPGRQ